MRVRYTATFGQLSLRILNVSASVRPLNALLTTNSGDLGRPNPNRCITACLFPMPSSQAARMPHIAQLCMRGFPSRFEKRHAKESLPNRAGHFQPCIGTSVNPAALTPARASHAIVH